MSNSTPSRYEPIARSSESTVVAEFIPDASAGALYQSGADLERALIELLQEQAYEFLPLTSEAQLVANLRVQLELLDHVAFSDAEWERFFSDCIAGSKDGIEEKTIRIQDDHIQLLKRRLATSSASATWRSRPTMRSRSSATRKRAASSCSSLMRSITTSTPRGWPNC